MNEKALADAIEILRIREDRIRRARQTLQVQLMEIRGKRILEELRISGYAAQTEDADEAMP